MFHECLDAMSNLRASKIGLFHVLKLFHTRQFRILVCFISLLPAAISQTEDEEFVGPFPSWSNLQRDYGVSTDSFQKALNELGTAGHSSDLFIPAGTYCVGPLAIVTRLGVSIEGADPANTVIKYCGPQGGTLLRVDGMAYSRIGRVTFDCSNLAAVAVDQAWDSHHPNFDTANEYSDVAFRNCPMAIRGGNLGGGFAETTVMRARFGPSSGTCVLLKNFNALDLWIWYSLFDHCETGVSNDPGAGAFHVYDSVFRGSAKSDLLIHNTGGFNARDNTSIGSAAFWTTTPVFGFPATTNLQGNRIIRDAEPFIIRNHGPVIVMDNEIESDPKTTGSSLSADSPVETDLLSVGNTWTNPHPVSAKGRYISLDDKVVSSLHLKEPQLPGTPPNLHRRVIEIPKGATAEVIQNSIDAASRLHLQRVVVHFPEGEYAVGSTIEIPRDADLQIVGDGWTTTSLKWAGRGSGPVVHVNGPSKAIFREIRISGANNAEGIVADGIDQPGSRVYLQQTQVRYNISAGLFVDRLDHTDVDLRNIGHSRTKPGIGIIVRGGKLAASGRPAGGKTNVYSGASSENDLSYDLSDGGRLLVRDIWYEYSAPCSWARLSGSGTFTVEGSRIALPANHTPPAIQLNSFRGTATFLTSRFDDRIVTGGDGSGLRLLVLGFLGGFNLPDFMINESSPKAASAFLLNRDALRGGSSVPIDDIGQADPAFLRETLAQTRAEHAGIIDQLPAKITDLRLYRVMVENGTVGIHLEP